MQSMNLSRVDLNLLVVLRALLETRSVTAAARRVGLSQPATSHALARLRELMGDPLLVRAGRGLVSTPRADAVKARLDAVLDGVAEVLEVAGGFDPSTANRTFRLGSSDYDQYVLLPSLLGRLARTAPGVDLWVHGAINRSFDDFLRESDLDAIIAPAPRAPRPGLRVQTLYKDRFVCLVREGHPRVRSKLTLDMFTQLPHAFVAPGGTRSGGIVDEVLKRHRRERRVAVVVPNFLVVPNIIARTDLIVTLAERVARSFATHLPLRILPPPIDLPSFSMDLMWHERMDADPAHAWLRGEVIAAAAEVTDAEKGPGGKSGQRSASSSRAAGR